MLVVWSPVLEAVRTGFPCRLAGSRCTRGCVFWLFLRGESIGPQNKLLDAIRILQCRQTYSLKDGRANEGMVRPRQPDLMLLQEFRKVRRRGKLDSTKIVRGPLLPYSPVYYM